MTRKILLILTALLFCSAGYSQDQESYDSSYEKEQKYYKLRNKYRNISFVSMTMERDGMSALKSNYGASLTTGKTYYLHRKPIAGMIRFGIDATWFDATYTSYIKNEGTESRQCHQAELGVHVGPSITVNPIANLNVHGYFRYAPNYSAQYMGDAIYMGYGSYFIGGGAVSYGIIGLGFEARFGSCNYKGFNIEEIEAAPLTNTKFKGWRAYISFRF